MKHYIIDQHHNRVTNEKDSEADAWAAVQTKLSESRLILESKGYRSMTLLTEDA